MEYYSISVIIATYKCERTIERCLSSIRNQSYPQSKIEILIIDLNSDLKTKGIYKKYSCKIYNTSIKSPEEAKAFGLAHANNEFVLLIDSDNILPEKNWLSEMIMPFKLNSTLTASYPLRYTYVEDLSLFNRYIALIGANDPIPFFLGKNDRQPYYKKGYNLAGTSVDKGIYYEVIFEEDNMPTLGANGFLIRRKDILQAKISKHTYFHIDVIFDLISKGKNTFAVVKNSIIHDTADTLTHLISKRARYLKILYLDQKNNRRYHIVRSKDYPMLFIFIFFSILIFPHLLVSVWGYMHKREIAWFVHPVVCLIIVVSYTIAFIETWIKKFHSLL
jgi:glycosyltransferase involved in cell wall biosynthesis